MSTRFFMFLWEFLVGASLVVGFVLLCLLLGYCFAWAMIQFMHFAYM